MTYVKKTLYAENISYVGMLPKPWACLPQGHDNSRGHVAKAKTTLAGMLPRENQKPIN